MSEALGRQVIAQLRNLVFAEVARRKSLVDRALTTGDEWGASPKKTADAQDQVRKFGGAESCAPGERRGPAGQEQWFASGSPVVSVARASH